MLMAPRIPRRSFRFRINLMLMKILWRTFAHSRSAEKSEFPLRVEPSRVFRFSTPNTLRIYVFTLRVVPSLPPRRYVQLTQIQSNLLEYMWSRETPLDAKIGGISTVELLSWHGAKLFWKACPPHIVNDFRPATRSVLSFGTSTRSRPNGKTHFSC